jgi:hypothetical protein
MKTFDDFFHCIFEQHFQSIPLCFDLFFKSKCWKTRLCFARDGRNSIGRSTCTVVSEIYMQAWMIVFAAPVLCQVFFIVVYAIIYNMWQT